MLVEKCQKNSFAVMLRVSVVECGEGSVGGGGRPDWKFWQKLLFLARTRMSLGLNLRNSRARLLTSAVPNLDFRVRSMPTFPTWP